MLEGKRGLLEEAFRFGGPALPLGQGELCITHGEQAELGQLSHCGMSCRLTLQRCEEAVQSPTDSLVLEAVAGFHRDDVLQHLDECCALVVMLLCHDLQITARLDLLYVAGIRGALHGVDELVVLDGVGEIGVELTAG